MKVKVQVRVKVKVLNWMLFKVKAGIIPGQPLTSGFRIHWAQSGTTLSLNLYWTKLFTSGERSKKYVLSCEFLETNFSKWIYSFGKFCPTFLYWRDQSGGLMVPPKSGREWSNYPFSHVEQSVQIPPFPHIFPVFIPNFPKYFEFSSECWKCVEARLLTGALEWLQTVEPTGGQGPASIIIIFYN